MRFIDLHAPTPNKVKAIMIIIWLFLLLKYLMVKRNNIPKIKPNNKGSLAKCKTILSHSPKDRYIADIWYLTKEYQEDTPYKYVLDMIDHFSKITNSYLLITKEALEVFSKIRNFIEIYGPPKYLITDKGKEFKNKILKNF